MSLIIESLRRGRQADGSAPALRRTRHADAVLATLGYSRERTRGGDDGRGLLPYAMAALIIVGGVWVARTLYFAERSSAPTRVVRSASPAASRG
ncbi:MAG: hypothetical protein LC804_28295, partial [Acidobacteria bacterium]|nr:hypothetical protein [Acidobacteriota bacterium]